MFDLGWTELLVIGVVALIVIGPKDLPGMFHALGKFTSKLRRMAREFQGAMEDAAKESGMKDAASDLKNMANPRKMGLDAVKDAADKFDRWDPSAKVDKPPGKDTATETPKGPETTKLSEESAEAARKIHAATAEKARAREAAAAEATATEAPDAAAPKAAGTGTTDA